MTDNNNRIVVAFGVERKGCPVMDIETVVMVTSPSDKVYREYIGEETKFTYSSPSFGVSTGREINFADYITISDEELQELRESDAPIYLLEEYLEDCSV